MEFEAENQDENKVSIRDKKPALSNSRLGAHFVCKFDISIDRITIVGELNTIESRKLNNEMHFNPYIYLYNTGHERFKADIEGIVHVEYDKLKGKSLNRRNMRVEFNPNSLNSEQKKMIYDLFVSKMADRSFSRLDIAFDTKEDLSAYYAFAEGQSSQMKKTIFYGVNDSPETKYFGTRTSDRYIRIYNKKQQLLDEKEEVIDEDYFWRVEVELKRDRTEKWQECLKDLNFVKPDWETIDNIKEQAMVYYLLHEESAWGKLHRNSKRKYKKLLKEISPINLVSQMKDELNNQQKYIRDTLIDWMR